MKRDFRISQILFFLFFVSANLNIYGQKIGIRIGFSSTNLGKEDNSEIVTKNMIGINSGLLFLFPNVPIKDHFLFETGAIFEKKGTKEIYAYQRFNMSRNTYDSFTNTTTIELRYISIPINAIAIIKTNKNSLIFSSGFYLACGISGKINTITKWTDSGNIVDDYKYSVNWNKIGFEPIDFKRFDYGLTGKIGIEKEPIQLFFQTELGLKNIHLSYVPYKKSNTTSYGILLTYFFKLK